MFSVVTPPSPPPARGPAVPRRRGPSAAHVPDRGGRPQEDQHGPPVHRGLPRRQRGGPHPLGDHQGHRVRTSGLDWIEVKKKNNINNQQ